MSETGLPDIPIESINSKIYFVRGKKVMLDSDLALLYQVETKALNQAVKRNPERFPDDFMFPLTMEEYAVLRSHNVTLKQGQHRKYLPFAFTENGVAMLSSVLRSPYAIQVNILIMRVFTQIREMTAIYKDVFIRINKLEAKQLKHDHDISRFDEIIRQMLALPMTIKRKSKPLGFIPPK